MGAEDVDGEMAFEHGTIAQVVERRDAGVVDEDVEQADCLGSFLASLVTSRVSGVTRPFGWAMGMRARAYTRAKAGLLDLFDGRQLRVYHAFFEPAVFGWPDHACVGCSPMADQVAHLAHLHARDTTLAFASRALQPDIERVKARMGWTMPWYTITDSASRHAAGFEAG